MNLKNLLYGLSLMLMTVASSACSGDKDELTKIIMSEGQSTEITYAANTSVGNIHFTAVANWSAYVSPASSTNDEVSWITLNSTNGSAGEVNLIFDLERNLTGESRTAFIVVICEDDKVSFKITQVAEDDPDEPARNLSGLIKIQMEKYINGANGLEYDGDTYYELYYEAGRLVEMICQYRDDVDKPEGVTGGDDYCETIETTGFRYDDVNGHVRATIRIESTYYPSKNVETEDSEHDLYYTIEPGAQIRALSGSYYYPQEDDYPTKFDFSYDSTGYLTQSRNDEGQEGKWNTSTFSWKSANLASITSSYDGYDGTIAFDYSDSSLLNTIVGFDLNWVLFDEFEVLDFGAGDITRIWAVAGFLGTPSKNLATSITETDKFGTKCTCRVTYKTHTDEKTEVRVEEFVNNQQSGYTDWEISYSGNLKN